MPERKPVILIVDDERPIHDLLRRLLAPDGWRIEVATSGEQALVALEREAFVNVLLTDLRMPGIGGVDVLRRAKERNADTEVIIMTAHASADTAIEAVRQGAFDYFQKPFQSVDEIRQKVRRALRQQALVLENRDMLARLEAMNKGLKQVVVTRTKELGLAQAAARELGRGLERIEREAAAAADDVAAAIKREVAECKKLLARATADEESET